jgi:predicted MFS family arabinose efflux permease
MAMLVMVPLVAITVVPRSELWVHLLISTALFVSMSGRMIPGMSIISSAVRPQHRGTFMTLNASVQSAAMGIAAWVGGHLIQRNPQGLIEHYWMAAAVGVLMSIAAIWWVGKLTLYTSVPRTAA